MAALSLYNKNSSLWAAVFCKENSLFNACYGGGKMKFN